MRSLFLGGPRHGAWEDTHGGPVIDVAVWETLTSQPFVYYPPAEPLPVEVFTYRLVILATEDGPKTAAYIPNTVPRSDERPFAMRELLRIAWDAAEARR